MAMILPTGNVTGSAGRDAGINVSEKSEARSSNPTLLTKDASNGTAQNRSHEIHNLRVALTLAGAGIFVHPCRPSSGTDSKKPYNDQWQDDAAGMTSRKSSGRFCGSTNDPKLIRKMWAKHPG